MAAIHEIYSNANGARFTVYPKGEVPESLWTVESAPCVSYALRPYGTSSGGAPVYQRGKTIGVHEARFGLKLEWPVGKPIDVSCLASVEGAAADHLKAHPEVLFSADAVPEGGDAIEGAIRRARGKNELVRNWTGKVGSFDSIELWRQVFKRSGGKPSDELASYASGLRYPLVAYDEGINARMETAFQATYDPPTVTYAGDKARLDKRTRAARMALLSLERGEMVTVAFSATVWVTKGKPQLGDAPAPGARVARWGIDLRLERVIVPRWRLYPRASTYPAIPEDLREVADFDAAAFGSLALPAALPRDCKYLELPLVDPKTGLAVCVRTPAMRLVGDRSRLGTYGDAGAQRELWQAKFVAVLGGSDGGLADAQAKLGALLDSADAEAAAPAASAEFDVELAAESEEPQTQHDLLFLRTRVYDGLGVRPRNVPPQSSVQNLDAEAIKEGYVRASFAVPEGTELVRAVVLPKAYVRDGKRGVRLELVALEPAGSKRGANEETVASSPSKRARHE